ncbi:autotransporter outer membrane beta-barrel domain-containing protein [Campylobacter sp. 2018MI01]|uniref:autotransporter outer membrane beta-barrel domain-containing protein n=1 Tax=Campylobacter sp. 2018MI01 TaxID=2836735 RepID=UPI001BDA5813|nr:autotransporter outer membrane beta-barrel domain-containing protein [Campylobacter sp. 2018MI01]MBT0879211.1 autotransporter outer membrane beta-barrel domain-containing protein [Campylobacter sp. 2018MI01]
MKKVLFSSVCAVALLGTNVYAVENSLSNSLDTFLSQKTELESKIKEQNTLIAQKQESVNNANNDYLAKDKTYKDLSKAITDATTIAGEKQGLKSKAELEHTNLVNQGNSLNTQKDNLNSEISQLESSITKYEEDLKLLATNLEIANSSVTEKDLKFKEALAKLDGQQEERKKLHTNYEEARKEHEAMLEKYNLADEEGKKAIETQLQEKETAKTVAEQALKASDNNIAPLSGAKDLAASELDNAKLQVKNIKNNQTNITNKKNQASVDLEIKKQDLTNTTSHIEENTKKQADAKANLEKAQKDFENASAAILTAKQNQADAKTALDTASEDLEKAKAELNTANNDLENLKKELENIEANITNNTEEGKKVKEELMSSGIYTTNTQTHANALISLAASHNGDLSNAAPEVKAQAQTLANQIATTILDEKKDDITAEALSTLNVQINNMNKRLGEVRGLNADIGTWFRIYGGRFSNGNNNFNYYSTQIGADKKTSLNNADILAGVLFGYDKINAGVRAKDTSVGAYLSYIHNDGYFADLVLKYIRSSYDSKFVDVKSQNSFLVSAEGGYRFNVNNNFYLEPSLEIITGYIGKYESSLKIFNKFKINVDAHSPLIFKPQIFAGYSVNDFTFRAGVGAVIDTQTKEADLLIGDIIKGVNAKVKSKLGASDRGFVSVGTAYTFSDNLRLNLSVERSFGTKLTNDYEINSTIRYTF